MSDWTVRRLTTLAGPRRRRVLPWPLSLGLHLPFTSRQFTHRERFPQSPVAATSFRDQAGDLTQSAEAPGGLTLNEGAGSRGGARAVGEAIGGGAREGGARRWGRGEG